MEAELFEITKTVIEQESFSLTPKELTKRKHSLLNANDFSNVLNFKIPMIFSVIDICLWWQKIKVNEFKLPICKLKMNIIDCRTQKLDINSSRETRVSTILGDMYPQMEEYGKKLLLQCYCMPH